MNSKHLLTEQMLFQPWRHPWLARQGHVLADPAASSPPAEAPPADVWQLHLLQAQVGNYNSYADSAPQKYRISKRLLPLQRTLTCAILSLTRPWSTAAWTLLLGRWGSQKI